MGTRQKLNSNWVVQLDKFLSQSLNLMMIYIIAFIIIVNAILINQQINKQIIVMQVRRPTYQYSQKSSNFQQAQRLAEAIGLTDNFTTSQFMVSPYISSLIDAKKTKRRINHSDLLPYTKKKSQSKVSQRKSPATSIKEKQLHGIRKNSLKNVVIMKADFKNRSLIFQKAQNIIHKKDKVRSNKFLQQSVKLKLISIQKQRRSAILKQVSDELPKEDQIQNTKNVQFNSLTPRNCNNKYFGRLKSSTERKKYSDSQQKLAISIDFNKFKIVFKKGEYLVEKNNYQKKIQSGNNLKRSFRLDFNNNNRFEILYNHIVQEAQF